MINNSTDELLTVVTPVLYKAVSLVSHSELPSLAPNEVSKLHHNVSDTELQFDIAILIIGRDLYIRLITCPGESY